MELKDYLRMLRKGWYWFLVTFAGVFFVDYFVVQKREVQYEAVADMVVRAQQRSPRDLLEKGQTLDRHYITEETRIVSLLKPPIVEEAVNLLLGDRPYTSGKVDEELQRQAADAVLAFQAAVLEENPDTDIRQALTNLIRASVLRSETDPRSRRQDVQLFARSTSPRLAIALANAQAEAAFIFDLDRERDMVTRTIAGLEKDLTDATQALDGLEKSRLAFAQQHGVYNLDKMEERLQDSIQELEDQKAIDQTQLQFDRERIQQWLEEATRTRLGGLREFPVGEIESQGLAGLTQQLAEARTAVERLLHGVPVHKDGSPELKRAKAAVQSLERDVESERRRLAENKLNAEAREIAELIRTAQLREKQIKQHETRRGEKEEELRKLSEILAQASLLERELELAREEVGDLSKILKVYRTVDKQIEGPVVFYAAATEAHPLAGEGQGTATRMLVLFLVAFIFGLGIVYFLEYIDTRLMSLHDVRRYIDMPLLGILHRERGSPSLLDLPMDHILAEKTSTAATLVQSAAVSRNKKVLMIVSTNQGEGKTTVVANLGLALARKGRRVIIVDADLRRPMLHQVFGVENEYGLTRLVGDRSDPGSLLEHLDSMEDLAGFEVEPYIQPTGIENLSIVPSGPAPDSPSSIIESHYMEIAVKSLADSADIVLIDTPPLGATSDALALARYVPECVFVVGAGKLERHEAAWAKNLLANVKAEVLGVILNFAVQEARDYHYYYQRGRARPRVRV